MGADHAGVAMAEDPVERRGAPDVRDGSDATELEGEPDRVIREERDHERRQVHHHHVPGVLRSREAGHQEREPDLHEQHEKAGEQQPREVDRDPEMPGLVRELVDPFLTQRDLLRAACREIVGDVARLRPTGVGVVAPLPDRDQGDQRHQRHQKQLLSSRHPHSLHVADRAVARFFAQAERKARRGRADDRSVTDSFRTRRDCVKIGSTPDVAELRKTQASRGVDGPGTENGKTLRPTRQDRVKVLDDVDTEM